MTKGDTEFAYPIGACTVPVINRDFTLKLNNGGNACSYSGPDLRHGQGGDSTPAARDAPLVLDGKAPNTMQGTWAVKAGRVVLAKQPGVDAMGGTIVVGGQGDTTGLSGTRSDQLNDAADVQLLSSDKGGAAWT